MKNKKKSCCDSKYPSHEKELPRLNRAVGQLNGVRKMISERRYCPEILQQLKAVRSAVKTVEVSIFKAHLDSCVANSFTNENDRLQKIAEVKSLLEKF